MITIKTNGKTLKTIVSIENLGKRSKEGLRDGFERMGKGLVRTLENNILNETKNGEVYNAKNAKGVLREYQSSEAGQTPALVSGKYFEGIYYTGNGANGLIFGNNVKYSEYLEEGTDKMKPRTGLKNALIQNLKVSRNYLEESLHKSIKS